MHTRADGHRTIDSPEREEHSASVKLRRVAAPLLMSRSCSVLRSVGAVLCLCIAASLIHLRQL